MTNILVKENKSNTKGQRNRSKGNSKDILSKSKENNSLTYLKKDLKDIKYFTYRKKGYYLTIYSKGKDINLNKILIEYLR